MKNKLSDLNNHLFAQLERLSDETIGAEQLQQEIERSRAVTSVSQAIIANADLALKARKAAADGLIRREVVQGMIGHEE